MTTDKDGYGKDMFVPPDFEAFSTLLKGFQVRQRCHYIKTTGDCALNSNWTCG